MYHILRMRRQRFKGSVDGVGPANMSGDLPSKKSQLDDRLFGVGVPAIASIVKP